MQRYAMHAQQRQSDVGSLAVLRIRKPAFLPE
jgi:hypothetical protein